VVVVVDDGDEEEEESARSMGERGEKDRLDLSGNQIDAQCLEGLSKYIGRVVVVVMCGGWKVSGGSS